MLAVLIIATQLAAPPLKFDQAKAMADANEGALPKALSAQLLQAQGNALGAAMSACGRPGMDLSRFAVVMSLNADGSVAQSWRKGETPLAKCVHRSLVETGLAGTWPTPFFTSVVLSFD